jgi:hypothetical protein
LAVEGKDGTDPADPVEVEFLALTLDRARVRSPLVDIGWLQGWTRGLLSAEDILGAAEDLDDD